MFQNSAVNKKILACILGGFMLSGGYASDIEHEYSNGMTLSADNHYLFAGADNKHIYKCNVEDHKCSYYSKTAGVPESMTTVTEVTTRLDNKGNPIKVDKIVILDSNHDLYTGTPDAHGVTRVYNYINKDSDQGEHRKYDHDGFVWLFKVKGDDNAVYAINKKEGIYRISFDQHSLDYLTPEIVVVGENNWWHSRAIYSDGNFYYLSDHRENDDDPMVNIVKFDPNDVAHSVVSGKTDKNFQFKIPDSANIHAVYAMGVAMDNSVGNLYLTLDYDVSSIRGEAGYVNVNDKNHSFKKITNQYVKLKRVIFNQVQKFAVIGGEQGYWSTATPGHNTFHGWMYGEVRGLTFNNKNGETYISSHGGHIYYCSPNSLNHCDKFQNA